MLGSLLNLLSKTMNFRFPTSKKYVTLEQLSAVTAKSGVYAILFISACSELGRPSLAQAFLGNGPQLQNFSTPDLGQNYQIDASLQCPATSVSVGGFGGNGNDWAYNVQPYGASSSSINNYGIAAGIRIPLGGYLKDFCKDYARQKSEFVRITTENYRRNSFLANLEQCRWLDSQGIELKNNKTENSAEGGGMGMALQSQDAAFMKFCKLFIYNAKDVQLPVTPGAKIISIGPADRNLPIDGSKPTKQKGVAAPQTSRQMKTSAPTAGITELNKPTPIMSSAGQDSTQPLQSGRQQNLDERPQAPVSNFSTPNPVLQLQRTDWK
jgi:hypothetical protein